MQPETKIILTALRNFLARDEIKNKNITAVMPKDPRLGNLSGKLVDVPLVTIFQGLTHKASFAEIANVLDTNNDIVCIFLEELYGELHDHVRSIEESNIPADDKDKEIGTISDDLKSESHENE